jgi:hypothetical protein
MSLLAAFAGSGSGNQSTFLEYSGALALGLLVVMDFRFNNNIVLIVEIEAGLLIPSR